MKVKSNISIASNIYIKSTKLENDKKFVENVSGLTALKTLERRLSGTLTNAKLNSIQRKEIKEAKPCSLAKNNEQTHGKIMRRGEIGWVGRCEYNKCLNYSVCAASRSKSEIIRGVGAKQIVESEEIDFDIEEYTYLGINLNEHDFGEAMSDDESIYEDLKEEVMEEWKDEDQKQAIKTEPEVENSIIGFEEIEEPTKIVYSNINSKILVNAGPGTGKTYTVIQRLLWIIETEIARPECVLVLCYSRAAVEVIKNRIQEGITRGSLPDTANMLNVCSFDSFATQYLIAIDEKFTHLDYNERIEFFNTKINQEMLEHFEYLIVDELQDIVNQRAQMVINIMKNIDCGYLLLGDRCQAIYDYDCDDGAESIKSPQFYDMLLEIVGQKVLKYELIKNNRQEKQLSDITDKIRKTLLQDDILSQNKNTKTVLKNITRIGKKAENFIPKVIEGEKTAVLCRSNGEAETISERFYSLGINHTLLRGADYAISVQRWLGDILWDYCGPQISKKDFTERLVMRLEYTEEKAEEIFGALNRFCGEETNIIKVGELAALIEKGADPIEEIVNKEFGGLSISTIHRAKGREFDHVYLLDGEYTPSAETAEESRVRYVAVTRPKKSIKIVAKDKYYNWSFKKIESGRSLRVKYQPRYGKSWCFCTNIALGLKGDVDPISFVSKEFFKESHSIDNQQYIAENIKKNDPLVIRFDQKKKRYLIYHEEIAIGALSKEISSEFWAAIYRTSMKRSIPIEFTRVYVKNVITIINTKFDDNIPLRFRESNVWLGIEITGLARNKFE